MSTARPSKRRRSEILEAAVDVIAERGICETRIADVARRAGMSAALVLYYFDSKDRLLTEALTHAEDRFYLSAFHDLNSAPRAADRLVRLIDRSFPARGGEDAGDWKLWIELWSRALRDPEVARKREALDRRWRETIAGVVREGQREGDFADVDAEAFALRFASLMDGLAIQAVLGDPEGGADTVRDICLEMAARELKFEPVAAAGRSSGRE
ncbi:MAG: TetR family transcriptional regulator [Actinomycetota bacterium]|nr:TetR family transcriptional regulator [Actinomycetota bacterium]